MTRRLGLHAALFSLAPLVQAQAPADPSVEWIRAHAIPFSTSEAGHGFDDLAGLEKMIGDARIVALGEPTHGTREAYQMKHRLLEYLVERHGFSIFSIEANMPETDALDAYVNGGEGDPRQLIADSWTWNTEEVLAMVEWMRAWNAAHPKRPRLRFTGFDMQTPTVAARIAAQFLRKHAPHMEQSAVLLEDLPARGEVDFTTATGAFPVEVARGKELIVSVWIRTEIPNGWAGLWWRCDTPRGTGAFDNMQSRGITGIRDWTRYETRLTIDDDVQNITFGCLLAGEGTAWFDDIEITLDGKPFVDPTFGFGFEEGTGSFVLPQRTPRGAGCVVRTVDKSPHGGERCLEIQRKPEPDTGLVKDAEGVLADMLAHRDEFARMTSAREADWAIQNARVVAQWARMTCAEYPSRLKSGVRDECMAENVAWILEQNPGTRAVLWAHNGHVSRAEFQGITPMGGHLGRRFPDQMVVFGFSTGRGTYTALAPRGIFDVRSDNPLQPPPEDSIESYLASARLPRFLLDIRAARDAPSASWAIVPHPMRQIGARATLDQQFFPCVVRDAFDVLVWQAETTASVLIRR